jgi:hypothetical protein
MMHLKSNSPLSSTLSLVIRKLFIWSSLGLLCLSLAPSLHAQWAVVDVDAIAGITKQVSQGGQQIQQLDMQYNQMKAMAQQAQGLFRYRGPQNIWQAFRYADQYATLSQWATGANSGDPNSIQNGYQQNTVLANIDTSLSTLNSGVARSRSALYATQSVMDGNNLAAMSAVGQIHAAAAQYKNAIDQLENDAEDPNDATQAQLAVEQRTSNALVIGLRAQQDTNNLLGQIAAQQVAQTKLTRDSIADSTNRALENQDALNAASSLSTNYTDSLKTWSLR